MKTSAGPLLNHLIGVGGPGGGVSCCSARCVARCSLAAAEVKTEQTHRFVVSAASRGKGRDGLSPFVVVIRLDLLLGLLRRAWGLFFLICQTLPSLSYVEEDAALFFAVYPRSGL
jgi:hypothetical protein